MNRWSSLLRGFVWDQLMKEVQFAASKPSLMCILSTVPEDKIGLDCLWDTNMIWSVTELLGMIMIIRQVVQGARYPAQACIVLLQDKWVSGQYLLSWGAWPAGSLWAASHLSDNISSHTHTCLCLSSPAALISPSSLSDTKWASTGPSLPGFSMQRSVWSSCFSSPLYLLGETIWLPMIGLDVGLCL